MCCRPASISSRSWVSPLQAALPDGQGLAPVFRRRDPRGPTVVSTFQRRAWPGGSRDACRAFVVVPDAPRESGQRMNGLFVVDEMAVLPHLVADSWDDAIRQLGVLMCRAGFTDAVYTEHAVERERAFPTGLQFGSTAVALPHGDSEHVWVPSLAVGRCERPVTFHAVDDPSQTLDVRLIVMPALTDPEAHLGIMTKLFEALNDAAFVEEVLAMDAAPAIAAAFRSALGVGGSHA